MFIFSDPLLFIAITLFIGVGGLFYFTGIRKLIPRGMKQQLNNGDLQVRIGGILINGAYAIRSTFFASLFIFALLATQSRLWETYPLLQDRGQLLVQISAGLLLAAAILKGVIALYAKSHPESLFLDRCNRLYPIAFIIQAFIAGHLFLYGFAFFQRS